MEKTKKCTKCGRELPLTEFYKHPKMTDGYTNVCKDCCKNYRKNPIIRAKKLISNYNASDIEHFRGKGDLTADWIIENIFSKPCAHCGKEGWDVIGCNRLDNNKPHSKENVEPCCKECNNKLHRTDITNWYSKQFGKG